MPRGITPITEELLASHICEHFDDPRLCNILEQGGIRTMLDLFRCCGRDDICSQCPEFSDGAICDRKKLMSLTNFGAGYLKMVYSVLEEKGIYVRRNP